MRQPAIKRARDAESARAAILAAAEEIFAQRGFTGARVDEIAKASGYNKSLIFHYFDDKLGLYRAVVGRCKAEIGAAIGRLMEPFLADESAPLYAAQVRAFTESAVRWSFSFYLANPLNLRVLGWEMAEGWRTFALRQTPGAERPWLEGVRQLLRRAGAAGIIRRELDPDLLLANLIGMPLAYLLSIPRYELFFPGVDLTSDEALARAREQMVALVLHGILPDPMPDLTPGSTHGPRPESG
jgi:AcrR family transcriptional regulator